MRAVQRKGRRADLFFIDHAADRFQTAWATLPPDKLHKKDRPIRRPYCSPKHTNFFINHHASQLFKAIEHCSKQLNNKSSKIVYKLVLEVGMINVSCWKLKRNTDKNRAISKVILSDGMAVCFGIIPAPASYRRRSFYFFLPCPLC